MKNQENETMRKSGKMGKNGENEESDNRKISINGKKMEK